MVKKAPYDRILRLPAGRSFFLFGMRGVGKSTWAKGALPAARRIDLLDEGLYQSYLREPALFANELRTIPRGTPVVVDEIQRLPALLNEVHRFIEDHGMRFVLLGSSARKLKQAGTNLLAYPDLVAVTFFFRVSSIFSDTAPGPPSHSSGSP